jgi:RNA polymerase sigma-70 factor, ECF subfamily
MSRTRRSEWAFREDRAFGRLIPEEISPTEHEANDCQREGAYGDFVPTVKQVGDKNTGVRPMKVANRYRSGKSDGELLIAAGAGDRRALEELYLGYQGRLDRFLSRFTRRRVIVEEIINDTFMVIWRDANKFRFASQVSSWIFGIAYRMALKSIRRERKHSATQSLDECPEQTVDPMLETEVQDWVMDGLNRLSEEQAVTLQLACHIGHSLVEIAEITGAPVGTVKARMFHARKNLRRHLSTLGGIVESPASVD